MLNLSFLCFLMFIETFSTASCFLLICAPVNIWRSSRRSFPNDDPDNGADKDLTRFLGDVSVWGIPTSSGSPLKEQQCFCNSLVTLSGWLIFLPEILRYLNYRHRNAKMASRASVELHTLIYFRKRPTDTEARILKIRSNGFIVFVPKYGIEGPVHLMPRGQKKDG